MNKESLEKTDLFGIMENISGYSFHENEINIYLIKEAKLPDLSVIIDGKTIPVKFCVSGENEV